MQTLTEQFYSLREQPEQQARWLAENIKEWEKEIKEEIEASKARCSHHKQWLNLYKVSPELANNNPHMGIIVCNKK